MKPAIIFLFLLFNLPAFSQTFSPVKDEAKLRKEIGYASQKIQTIRCEFKQEKTLSMLSEKAISKGKFYFKKDGLVRLEYLTPNKNLLVMNKGKMLMQDDRKTSQVDMHRNRIFRQLNDIIVGSVNGNLFSGNEFISRFFENATSVKIELTPTSKTLKNYLSNIVLVLEKKDFTALRIEMNEPSGDNTILSFSSKELNMALADSLFAVR